MNSETRAHEAVREGTTPLQAYAGGEVIYEAGDAGCAWRVVSGSVRLDRVHPGGHRFAGLAVSGDVIGAETMLCGSYAFEARSLSACVLEPWPERAGRPRSEALLLALSGIERRAADVIGLRCGQAVGRVRRLIRLLAGPEGGMGFSRVALPGLRDMAEITDLTVETVSRMISRLRKEGVLCRESRRRTYLLETFPAGGE